MFKHAKAIVRTRFAEAAQVMLYDPTLGRNTSPGGTLYLPPPYNGPQLISGGLILDWIA